MDVHAQLAQRTIQANYEQTLRMGSLLRHEIPLQNTGAFSSYPTIRTQNTQRSASRLVRAIGTCKDERINVVLQEQTQVHSRPMPGL